MATLKAGDPSPFPPLSDETAIKKDEPVPAAEAKTDDKDKKKESDKAKNADKDKGDEKKDSKDVLKDFKIDLDGIQNRIVAIPMPPSQIRGIAAGKGMVYYATAPVQGLSGPLPGEETQLHAYDLKERKDKVMMEGVDRFTLSFDGSKLMYQAGGGNGENRYGIIDAKPGESKKVGEGALKLDGMRVEVDPPQEWKQMFHEVWRQERDYFFEQSMNGVDWEKIREKYEALLPSVSSRYDLTYILGEMIGELSNSHTYVGGGDMPELPTVRVRQFANHLSEIVGQVVAAGDRGQQRFILLANLLPVNAVQNVQRSSHVPAATPRGTSASTPVEDRPQPAFHRASARLRPLSCSLPASHR